MAKDKESLFEKLEKQDTKESLFQKLESPATEGLEVDPIRMIKSGINKILQEIKVKFFHIFPQNFGKNLNV